MGAITLASNAAAAADTEPGVEGVVGGDRRVRLELCEAESLVGVRLEGESVSRLRLCEAGDSVDTITLINELLPLPLPLLEPEPELEPELEVELELRLPLLFERDKEASLGRSSRMRVSTAHAAQQTSECKQTAEGRWGLAAAHTSVESVDAVVAFGVVMQQTLSGGKVRLRLASDGSEW